MARQKNLFFLTVLFCYMFFGSAQAQDPGFSQFYANPLYLNPALAGAGGCPKIHVNVRDQWPSLQGTFITNSVSYDKHLPEINSGWGFQVLYDNAGLGFLNTVNANLMYSYQLKINKKYYALFGARLGMHSRFIDKSQLLFPDQLSKKGVVLESSQDLNNINDSKITEDIGLGGIFYADIFFVGYSVDHLTQPITSFLKDFDQQNKQFNASGRLPMKHTVHGGANFSVSGNKRKGLIGDGPFMTAGFVYQNQGAADQFNIGLSLTNKSISGGLWYRTTSENSDAVIAILGYSWRNLKIGYSYDITISELNRSGGAHELSVRIQLPCKEKVRKIQPLTCPIF